MDLRPLEQLNRVTAEILAEAWPHSVIGKLRQNLEGSADPFVWVSFDLRGYRQKLPPEIRSGWFFLLKHQTPSIAHLHPNSVQHTVVLEGTGEAQIGEHRQRLSLFDRGSLAPWVVIPRGIPHEFFPGPSDLVVLSFHTCRAAELLEISTTTGQRRGYSQ